MTCPLCVGGFVDALHRKNLCTYAFLCPCSAGEKWREKKHTTPTWHDEQNAFFRLVKPAELRTKTMRDILAELKETTT